MVFKGEQPKRREEGDRAPDEEYVRDAEHERSSIQPHIRVSPACDEVELNPS